ncbi:M15 family metallopeptidase [Thermodesulfobacteriota bacterium]
MSHSTINIFYLLLFLILLVIVAPSHPDPAFSRLTSDISRYGPKEIRAILERLPHSVVGNGSARTDLMAILMSYPGFCVALETDASGKLFVVMSNRTKIPYDDGKKKDFEAKLNNPDLQDMLSQVYRPGPVTEPAAKNHDPGRFRVTGFFKAVYGSAKREVRANLVPVSFCGKTVLFNKRNGAADALKRVGSGLQLLLRKRPDLGRFVSPIGGTFAWREISGTTRLSPHSFGIAIDLNPKQGDYWRWNKGSFDLLHHLRRYPIEIVDIFERNGFIWGGKWSHYDSMHFEYRPELLLKARNLSVRIQGKEWKKTTKTRRLKGSYL